MEKKKQRFYKAKWFLWVWIILFPPIGIILLWTCQQQMQRKTRIILSAVCAVWFIILMVATSGGSPTTPTSVSHIYDNAEVKDVINGARTKKIGEYSIIKVKSSEVTEESLTDWYFNYVVKHNYNCCMILYTDKNNTGVYSISGMVQKDVPFELDEYGDYSLGDTSKGILYMPSDQQTLKIYK